jgi:small-conductance mechanosensitive channel
VSAIRAFLATFPTAGAVAAAVTLLGAAILHVVVRWWLHRTALDDLASSSVAWAPRVRRLLRDIASPTLLLLWTHAVYLTTDLLLGAAGDRPALLLARQGVWWIYALTGAAATIWLAARMGRVAEAALRVAATRTSSHWDDLLLPLLGRAIRRILPLLPPLLLAPALATTPAGAEALRKTTSIAVIGAVAFVLYQIIDAASALLLSRHDVARADNLRARAVHTQVMVLKKVAVTALAVFTLASMLMVFESVRQFGASILASAGIAGLIIGFAAQRSLATLVAGFQIAVTQPFRVDDVVIVEGEWGRIEEITLTYVVVRIWDLRRLVVPLNYFIEQPFENWTRTSSEVLAPAIVHADYGAPIAALRDELTRVLERSAWWDGKVNVLQVTNATDRSIEIRALASAADASAAWDLRCEIREALIRFLQMHHPESLPRLRAAVDMTAVASAGRHPVR